MTRNNRKPRRRGFTLVEVLLVLVILVIIASLSVTVYSSVQREANTDAARVAIQQFQKNLELFHLHVNDYPTTAQGLEALMQPPPELASAGVWRGPYIRTVPLDPWRRPYQYEYPGRHSPTEPDIWSLGNDGQDGTDDDVCSWAQ